MSRVSVLAPAIVFVLLLFVSCKSRRPVVQPVPVREVSSVELKTIELPGDTVIIQVPFERLSNGSQTAGVATSPNGLQLLWQLRQGMLELQAKKPPDEYLYPELTTYKEVPVEVVREVQVNKLHRWQKLLIWVGVVTALWLAYQVYKITNKRKRL